jgi:hypothetical protein
MEKFKLVRELSTGFPAFDGEKSPPPLAGEIDDNSRTNKKFFNMPMTLPNTFQNQQLHISCLFGLFYALPSLKVYFALTPHQGIFRL